MPVDYYHLVFTLPAPISDIAYQNKAALYGLLFDITAGAVRQPGSRGGLRADCVAATAGFGIAEMFWCAGCQGGISPFDGHLPDHMGGVRTAALIAQRLTAKMHRELLAWGWHGRPGLCGPYFLPAMDKTAYKTQMNPSKAGPKVLIFVSSAMPEATLQPLLDQAAYFGEGDR